MSPRLHSILPLVLICAGSALLITAPVPRDDGDIRWVWIFGAVGLWFAGLGIFLAMVADAVVGLIRLRRDERSEP